MNAENLNRKMHNLTGGIGMDWVVDGWHLLMSEMEEHGARPNLAIKEGESWFTYADDKDTRQMFMGETEGEAVVSGYIAWSSQDGS